MWEGGKPIPGPRGPANAGLDTRSYPGERPRHGWALATVDQGPASRPEVAATVPRVRGCRAMT
jgi:hypothetical protein